MQRRQERRWTSHIRIPRTPSRSDKLAQALLTIVDEDPTPRRFIAGADVVALVQRKIDELHEQIESHRELSTSLTFDPHDEKMD